VFREARAFAPRLQRGSLAFLGDFVSWIGILRRLQIYIDQANLKYRAAEVLSLCLIIAVTVYIFLGFVGLSLFILRAGLGVLPVLYISRIRSRRLHKFELNAGIATPRRGWISERLPLLPQPPSRRRFLVAGYGEGTRTGRRAPMARARVLCLVSARATARMAYLQRNNDLAPKFGGMMSALW
jgi:hypothetical protein